MAADSGGSHQSCIEPFIHQVGGHSSMLQLDEDTICKPLIPQELSFYESAPDSLLQFMPKYKGTLKVSFSQTVDGYLDVKMVTLSSHDLAFPPKSVDESREHKTKHRIRVCHSGSVLIEANGTDDTRQTSEAANDVKVQNGCQINPWVLHCHQQQMVKIHKALQVINMDAFTKDYILLENRVSKFKAPCIMDIKMGTRQYGDNASMAKRKSHIAKVAASTSGTLGMRLSGMQVYHHETGRLICHDKYYGHSLTEDGFYQTLHHFLCSGAALRHDIISALLEKLQSLYAALQSLHTFRFFTSSLLIMYDGKEQFDLASNNKTNNYCCSQKSKLCFTDNGNMGRKCKEDFFPNNQVLWGGNDSTSVCIEDTSTVLKDDPPLVDICMIDFAHSTQSQMSGSCVAHAGPDEGYLFGLKNLMTHLETLQRKNKCL